MFCLNHDCVLIMLLYWQRFYVWCAKLIFIVISKMVVSESCPTHFAVTFAGTLNIHSYTRNINISGFHCTRHIVLVTYSNPVLGETESVKLLLYVAALPKACLHSQTL